MFWGFAWISQHLIIDGDFHITDWSLDRVIPVLIDLSNVSETSLDRNERHGPSGHRLSLKGYLPGDWRSVHGSTAPTTRTEYQEANRQALAPGHVTRPTLAVLQAYSVEINSAHAKDARIHGELSGDSSRAQINELRAR